MNQQLAKGMLIVERFWRGRMDTRPEKADFKTVPLLKDEWTTSGSDEDVCILVGNGPYSRRPRDIA